MFYNLEDPFSRIRSILDQSYDIFRMIPGETKEEVKYFFDSLAFMNRVLKRESETRF